MMTMLKQWWKIARIPEALDAAESEIVARISGIRRSLTLARGMVGGGYLIVGRNNRTIAYGTHRQARDFADTLARNTGECVTVAVILEHRHCPNCPHTQESN